MFFIEFLVIHGTFISRRGPSGGIWIKDYRIIYFHVCMRQQCYIFNRGFCCLVCFLRKLWVWEKIHLKFEKPWEMKNLLLWDLRKAVKLCNTWWNCKSWEVCIEKKRGLLSLLSGKLNDPHTSASIHTGLYKLKSLYNRKKI